ncbi:MAG: DNA-directed RNA polymerase subunit K [Euryarchaeota archaeon]|nr:DNA-directed RNA polymerase subunit K [Euryarchaeota archaeon]
MSPGKGPVEDAQSPVRRRAATRSIRVNHVKQFGYTRFERARIIGARALQITMGAPILINAPKEEIDPIKIATVEFEKGAIPITVMRDDRIITRGAAK